MNTAIPVQNKLPEASTDASLELAVIAVPTRTNRTVDEHFGHCAQFTLFTVGKDKAIQESGIVFSPPGCGCKSNIAALLKQKGVSILLAGSMGDGAVHVLQRHGIQVHRGCSGDASKAAEAFLAGRWKDSGIACTQHQGHGGNGLHDGNCRQP